MLGFLVWRERMVRALIACSLVMLVFGPSLDAVLCLNDGQTPAAIQTDTPQLAAESDRGDALHDIGGSGGLCLHGHCHHGLQYLVASLEPLPAPGATARQYVLTRAIPAESLNPSGLDRPPRA